MAILFILLIGATDSALSRLMGLISLKEAYRNNINSYLIFLGMIRRAFLSV